MPNTLLAFADVLNDPEMVHAFRVLKVLLMDEQTRQELYSGLVLQKMQKIQGLDVQIHAQDWQAVSNTALALLDLDSQLRAHERTAPELADAE